jgi:hypothetical protein
MDHAARPRELREDFSDDGPKPLAHQSASEDFSGHLVRGPVTAAGGQEVTATEPAEIFVWEMHPAIAAHPPGESPAKGRRVSVGRLE